jgi:hypothetical protein
MLPVARNMTAWSNISTLYLNKYKYCMLCFHGRIKGALAES